MSSNSIVLQRGHLRQVKNTRQIENAKRLIARLERLSADSYWAHQASGVRGALLRQVDAHPRGVSVGEKSKLEELMRLGYFILEQAARELERKV